MSKKRVLLVDDDLFGSSLSREALKSEGWDVSLAASGEQAMALLEAGSRPDAALVDLDLGSGGMAGAEAVRRIRAGWDIPVVALAPGADGKAPVKTPDGFAAEAIAKAAGWEKRAVAAIVAALARREAERAGFRETGILKDFLEAIPEPAALLDADGRILAANSAQIQEGNGEVPAGLDSASADRYRASLAEVISTGASSGFEVETAGRRFRFLLHPVPAAPAGPRRVAVIRLDVTESRRREEDLERSEAFYRRLAEKLPEAVIQAGPDGLIRFANPAAAELLGFSEPAEIAGRPLIDLVAREADLEAEGILRRPPDGARALRGRETSLLRRDGASFAAEISLARCEGADGGEAGIVLSARDVGERKAAAAAASKALEEKTTLLKDIRQRIKSHMAVISSWLALEGERLHDPRDREISRMMRNRVRSLALVYDRFYRAEDVHGVDAKAYLELLVRQVGESHSPRPGQIRIDLRLESFPLDLKSSIACGLIATELVSNCLKHAFPGGRKGTVEVAAGRRGEGFFLSVKDDGIGYEKSAAGHPGDGLGLKIVRSQVDQLKGALKIEEGFGSRFEVEFPSL